MMAPETTSTHKRFDSVVDGTDPNVETLVTAQNFCAAVSSLNSEHGFQAIQNLTELVPQQKREIEQLKTGLAALEHEHEDFKSQQLSQFEGRYEQWRQEKAALQDRAEGLAAAAKEREAKMASLQQELGIANSRIDDLEKSHSLSTKRIKDINQQQIALEAALKHAQTGIGERDRQLNGAWAQRDDLKTALDEEKNQNEELRNEINKLRERNKNFIQLSVQLKELDLDDIGARLEKLWKTATTMIEKFFRHDLPDHILKADWTRIRENRIFGKQIDLLQSNSETAKMMRTVLILGVLARLVDKFVFQPNYFLHEESGLREILRDQISVSTFKERYTRGILLSMSPEEEEEVNEDDRVHFVAEELVEQAGTKTLLGAGGLAPFIEALESFLRQCLETWKIIQRGKQKLETSFNYSASAKRPWHVLSETPATDPLTVTDPEDSIIIIPRIYVMEAKKEPDPLTHGCIVLRSHLNAAAEEMRRDLPSAPFSQNTSSRPRRRPARTTSVSRKPNSFLA